MKKYIVELTTEERSQLEELSNRSRGSAQRRRRAGILLAADQGPLGPAMKDADIAKAYRCRVQSVERIRKALIEDGLDSCLRHGNTGAPRKKTFDGEAEAHLIALGCSRPPEGRTRWTLRLLADRVVELGIVESCDPSTVHHTLKKTNSSLT
jgi:hypothetical protein